MLTAEHVAVNVTDPGHWEAATPLISSTISAALQSAAAPDGEAAVTARGSVQSAAAETVWEEGSIEAAVDEVLQAHIRPYVLDDGGDIRLVGVDAEGGVARVHLTGACSGCPSSTATLHGKVEATLKYFVPEVQRVLEVSAEEAGPAPAADAVPQVSIEEHMRRLVAEGEATSVVWDEEELGRPFGKR